MEANTFPAGHDAQASAFINLMLRKGYDGRFRLSADWMEPVEGFLEQCLLRLRHVLQSLRKEQVSFQLTTLACYQNEVTYRECVLHMQYHHQDGYVICQLTILSPASRQARLISFTQNDQLPFLRHIRETKRLSTSWLLRVPGWFSFHFPKYFKR